MEKTKLLIDLENARAKLQQMYGSSSNLEDFLAAQEDVLECERKVAAGAWG